MRHVNEEDDCYLDEYFLFKRYHRQGEIDEDLVVTSDQIKFKEKILHVVQRVWK